MACHTTSPSTSSDVHLSPMRWATRADASWSGWTSARIRLTFQLRSQSHTARDASVAAPVPCAAGVMSHAKSALRPPASRVTVACM